MESTEETKITLLRSTIQSLLDGKTVGHSELLSVMTATEPPPFYLDESLDIVRRSDGRDVVWFPFAIKDGAPIRKFVLNALNNAPANEVTNE